jgi:CHAT domain-containing protein
MEHTGFPSDETLASFLDGKLDPETRRRVIEHMTTCDECYAVVMGSGGEVTVAEEKAAPRASDRRWPWLSAAAVAAFALIGLISFVQSHYWSSPAPGIADLRAADESPLRVTEARLADFPFKRFETLRGGSSTEEQGNMPLSLLIASQQIETAVKKNPSAENLHALGVSLLFRHRWKEAVEALGKASAKNPRDVEILVDLSAGHLARSETKECSPDDAMAALNAANAALQISPNRREALYNCALALDKLNRKNAAKKAWAVYFSVDPDSPWTDEVKDKHTRDSGAAAHQGSSAAALSPIAARLKCCALAVRLDVTFTLLPKWAGLELSGRRVEARQAFDAVRLIGKEMTSSHIDNVVEQATDEIAGAYAQSAHGVRSVALGYTEMAKGRAAYTNNDYGQAAHAYREALSNFATFPVARNWAEMALSATLFSLGDYERASQLALGTRDGGPLLRAEGQWVLGMVDLAHGRPYESLSHYRQALTGFTAVGDVKSSAAIHNLLAEDLSVLGERDQAWRERVAGLIAYDNRDDPWRAQVVLDEVAEAASGEGYLYAAISIQNEVVQIAQAGQNHAETAYAFLWRGLFNARAGRLAAANDDLRQASRESAQIEDPVVARRTDADVELASALAVEGSDPTAAVVHYSNAISKFNIDEYRHRSTQLLLGRGRAYLRSGNPDLAITDFLHGIEETEKEGAGISEAGLLSSYYGRTQDLFIAAVETLVQQGRMDEAFEIADEGRERAFCQTLDINDRLGPPLTHGKLIAALQHRLKEGRVALVYSFLPQELVAWEVFSDRTAVHRLPVTRKRVEELLDRHSSSWPRQEQNAPGLSVALYEMLFRPVLGNQQFDSLIIIPDGPLNRISFAALRDASGKYLVERAAITYTPSISALMRVSSRLASPPQKQTVVFGGGVFGDENLPALPAAETEMGLVAACYPGALVCSGDAATRELFLSRASKSDVLHLVGHGIVDAADPAYSCLVFGPSSPDAVRRLYARELAGMRLRPRLVFLSACSTGVRPAAHPGGISTIARAFAAAGVHDVVATMWDVSDGRAILLIRAFHEEIASGMAPADALRKAQLAMLRSHSKSDHDPAVWSAYTLLETS